MIDLHIHSEFSPDSNIALVDVVEEAIRKNLKIISFTDHFDAEDLREFNPVHLDFNNYVKEISSLKKRYESEIKILLGIEIGLQDEGKYLPFYDDIINKYPFDFVIGSVHKGPDGSWVDFNSYLKQGSILKMTLVYYQYILDCISKFSNFDVLGHLNVIDRYVNFPVSFDDVKKILIKIFMKLVEKNKGLEINTSGEKYFMAEKTMPTKKMLELYKILGGNIITIGSDSHTSNTVGNEYDYAKNLAEEIGFRSLSYFENRELKTIPI
ncbi:MAG: histidinol-phosphatase HisJ family protein [Clostridiales Family XIII bacterium]|jgi:histidinol-phosphatase (PHP family)|nr:histidinol-phosphatase HisJ family protein [Clostridiales Family XIII bacterium]